MPALLRSRVGGAMTTNPTDTAAAVEAARTPLRELAPPGRYSAVDYLLDALTAAIRADERAKAEAHYSSLSACDGEYIETIEARLAAAEQVVEAARELRPFLGQHGIPISVFDAFVAALAAYDALREVS